MIQITAASAYPGLIEECSQQIVPSLFLLFDGYIDFDIDGTILLPETKMDGDDYKNEGLFKDNRQAKTK